MPAPVFIGIDPTAGRRPMNVAVLDGKLGVLRQATGSLVEVVALVGEYPSAVVAVDAPQSLNAGLLANPEHRARLGLAPAVRTWSGYKVCEWELKRRGIGLYNTPTDEAAAPVWMRVGFQLFEALRSAGCVPYRGPGGGEARQVMEVHPHACFTVLLGRLPLPKNTLEGRLQRQMALYRSGLDVPDPLAALEELTPHALLEGRVDLPGVLDHDALDALVAAYTACLAASQPPAVTLVGDAAEGQIVLPIAPGGLLDRYGR
jgi:predicted nuclease with RNAse H fold